jgi:hypothetical protein
MVMSIGDDSQGYRCQVAPGIWSMTLRLEIPLISLRNFQSIPPPKQAVREKIVSATAGHEIAPLGSVYIVNGIIFGPRARRGLSSSERTRGEETWHS